MRYVKFIFILILIVIVVPIVSKADTWLDDPSYRDTSWFDPDTYEEMNDFYNINSKAKLAGLLYLVNIEGYDFAGKIISIKGDEQLSFCRQDETCGLDMTAHDWIPLKNSPDAIFATMNGLYYPYPNYVVIKDPDGNMRFTENDKIRHYYSEMYDVFDANFFTKFARRINVDVNTGGNITIDDFAVSTTFPILDVEIHDGYYLDDIDITNANGVPIEYRMINENQYTFLMPNGPVNIKVVFKEKNKEKCVIINGTGHDLGDEIACGSEHFYVLSNDGTNIRMLAKYNLHTGISIYKEKIEKEDGDTRSDQEYCNDLATSRGGTVKSDAFYTAPGYCFYKIILPIGRVIQTEDSKSAHWDEELNYLYPQVGDVYMFTAFSYSQQNNVPTPISNISNIEDTFFYDYTIDSSKAYQFFNAYLNYPATGVLLPLDLYKKRLIGYGVDVIDISMLSISELNDIVNTISGDYLPLKEWSDDTESISGSSIDVTFGSFKEVVPSKYKWLYSTTYWNSTFYDKYGGNISPSSSRKFVFTAEQGKICGAGFSVCAPTTTLGCGIRPVITIPSNSIVYEIKTDTDDHSEVEVIEYSKGNVPITFKTNISKNYKLDTITIKTDGNEEVTFTEGELTTNQDGSITINSNLFTMPYEDVTITVRTKPALNVEVIKNDNCEITLSKEEEIEEGENILINIKCNEGYEFTSLEAIDDENNKLSLGKIGSIYTFAMPSSNVKVRGVCSLITYDAEIIKEENSKITLSKEKSITPSEEVTINMTCDDECEFESLEVIDKDNNKVTYTKTDDKYKFSMPASDVKVSGICKKIEKEEPVIPDKEEEKEEKPNENDKEEPVVPSETESVTPITNDNIIIYVILLVVSVISLVLVAKKTLFNNK